MPKSPETLDKVAATKKAQGDRLWASAKNEGNPNDFNKARTAYETARRAKESANRLRNE